MKMFVQTLLAATIAFALVILVMPWLQKRHAYWRLYLKLKRSATKIRSFDAWIADQLLKFAKEIRKKAIGI